MVLTQTMGVVAAGPVAGLFIALLGARSLEAVLFGVQPQRSRRPCRCHGSSHRRGSCGTPRTGCPRRTQFDVVEQVGPEALPIVIFVTAWDHHAIRAFEANALDYLLKPIDDDRFDQALERARRRFTEQRQSAMGRRLSAAFAEAGMASSCSRIWAGTTSSFSPTAPGSG